MDEHTGLRGHADYPVWMQVRAQIAELSRIRTFNEMMHTSLLSLDDIPVDLVDLVLAWAAVER